MPSQPRSAICVQFSGSQPFSVAAILRRFSNGYLSRTKRSAASCSCFCSSERDRSICSSSKFLSPAKGRSKERGNRRVQPPLPTSPPSGGEEPQLPEHL